MLNTIRQYRRAFLGILLLLILPSFVVVGAWDLVPAGSNPQAVAEINGRAITKAEFTQIHERRVADILTQSAGAIRREQLDTPAARQATLEQIIQARMLNDIAVDSGLRVSEARMQQVISQIPEFQKDGRYSFEQAKLVLQDQGYTPARFEAELRDQLGRELLPSWVSGGAVAPRKLARRLSQSTTEVRVVKLHWLDASDALGKNAQAPTEADIAAAYEQRKSEFQLPTRVDIEALILKSEGSASRVDTFTNLVFESPESLAPAADALGLKILRISGLAADGSVAGGTLPDADSRALVASPTLAKLVFGAEGMASSDKARKNNAEAFELSPGVLASFRVVAVQPERARPLAEVRGLLLRRLVEEKNQTELLAMADAWRTGKTTSLPAEKRLELRRDKPQVLLGVVGNNEALASRVANEVFGDQLLLGQKSVVALGNKVLALELLEQRWAPEGDAAVVAQLRAGLGLLEQIDRQIALPGVLQAAEKGRGVERFASRLEKD